MDSEMFKPFKLNFAVFKTFGMWQDGNHSLAYAVYGYLLYFVLIVLYVICLLIYALNATDLNDFISAFGVAATMTAEAFKCLNFFLKVKEIIKNFELLKELIEFSAYEKSKDREQIKKHSQTAFRVLKWFWSSAMVNCVCGIFVPIFTHQLPYKAWFPFNTEYGGSGFWIASVYLVFNSFVVALIDINLDCLPAIFMSFGVGLIEELIERLENIGKVKETDDGAAQPISSDELQKLQEIELKKCIEVHLKIEEYIKGIETNFANVIVIQGLISSIILCCCAFTMSLLSIDSIVSFLSNFPKII
jgi:7tm Odorant receptor